MADTFRAVCAELLSGLDELANPRYPFPGYTRCAMDRARTLLAQPEPEGLTDEALLELMPQQFRDDLATVSRVAAHGAGSDITPGIFRVSLNTGALDYARAAIAADRARWCRPTPQPPADGEVGELVERLKSVKQNDNSIPTIIRWGLPDGTTHHHRISVTNDHASDCERAAKLLERFVSPAYLVINPSPEALASLKSAGHGRIEAMAAERMRPVPVPVSERPWERKGWCDEQGRCWLGGDQLASGFPTWILGYPAWASRFPDVHYCCLPFNALPLPQTHGI